MALYLLMTGTARHYFVFWQTETFHTVTSCRPRRHSAEWCLNNEYLNTFWEAWRGLERYGEVVWGVTACHNPVTCCSLWCDNPRSFELLISILDWFWCWSSVASELNYKSWLVAFMPLILKNYSEDKRILPHDKNLTQCNEPQLVANYCYSYC